MDFSKIDGSIRFCRFLYEGTTRHYICRYREYCCSQGCCASSTFTFYQLWYFWLLLLLIILVCSGSGWWFRWRQAGSQLHHSSPSPVTNLRRRGAARRGVYPHYQEPHPLDADPPSYREVMRRLNDFPQPTNNGPGTRGSSDMGWVTAPPPSYETILDLRAQQSKLEREIRNEERNVAEALLQRDSTDLYEETLRRGPSARTRPSVSARQRLRSLLGRVMPRPRNHNVIPVPKEPTAVEPPPPYMISTHHHFHQQPVAWSVNTPTMAVHPSFQPPPAYNVNPHLGTAPHYPVMYSAPYVAYPSHNHPMMNNDVDEWSRVDTQPHAALTMTSSQTVSAVTDLTNIPGEFHPPDPGNAVEIISPTLSSPVASIHSSGNSRASCIVTSQASVQVQAPSSNQRNSAGSSRQGAETSSPSASVSSQPQITEQNLVTSNASTIQQSDQNSSNDNQVDYSAEFVSTLSSRFATRPVSSTTLPTPGRTMPTNLPGSAGETNLQEEPELELENSTTPTSNPSQDSALEPVHTVPPSNPTESATESSAPVQKNESNSMNASFGKGDQLPTLHQPTRSGAPSLEADASTSQTSEAVNSTSSPASQEMEPSDSTTVAL